MTLSKESNRRRLLTGICLAGLGILYVTNPLHEILIRGRSTSPGMIALRGFATPLHMLMLIGSVLAVMQLLRHKSDIAGLIGGALTMMGWTAGVRILGLGQLEALLASGVTGLPADTLQKLFEPAPIVWLSIVPMGILYPAGLLVLGLTLAIRGPLPAWMGLLLAIGGLLFPLGRIPNLPMVITACDLVLGPAWLLIGWQVLSRPELWSQGAGEIRAE